MFPELCIILGISFILAAMILSILNILSVR